MTSTLLWWFAKKGVKGGQKLKVVDGCIEEADLVAFDGLLNEPWETRYVPSGITEELKLSDPGKCPACSEPCSVLEEAHIHRLHEELEHYSQHPHNLILLCRNCHGRYDRKDEFVTHEAIKNLKQQQLSRLMENVDRDIRLSRLVPQYLDRLIAEKVSEHLAIGSAPIAPAMAPVFAQLQQFKYDIGSDATLSEGLRKTAQVVYASMPITGSTLSAFATAFEKLPDERVTPSQGDVWEEYDSPIVNGLCLRDNSPTGIEDISCDDCGSGTGGEHHGEVPHQRDGVWYISTMDARGDHNEEELKCDDCGSTNLLIEFQSLCDYCEHMQEKMMDDD